MNAVKLAEYVIWHANQRDIRITSLKLQKILYLLQCESLNRFGAPLFYDKIEAWTYGPVVPSVYFKFCENECLPLSIKSFDQGRYRTLAGNVRAMIDDVLEKTLPLSARSLVCITRSTLPYRNLEPSIQRGERPEITLDSLKSFCCNEI